MLSKSGLRFDSSTKTKQRLIALLLLHLRNLLSNSFLQHKQPKEVTERVVKVSVKGRRALCGMNHSTRYPTAAGF